MSWSLRMKKECIFCNVYFAQRNFVFLTFRFSLNVQYIAALQIRAGQRSITASLWPLTAHIYHVMIIVTGGFSKKSFLLLFSEGAVRSCSSKQVLEILQYSQENVLESLFNKLMACLTACNFTSSSFKKRLYW